MRLAEIVQRGWDAAVAGEFDALVADYVDDMIFVMPGQTDIVRGRQGFREALNGIGEMLPSGFEITGLRHVEGAREVVSICEWKSATVAASQLAVLFRFDGDKIFEERWFIDTEQWKNAA